MMWVEWGSSHFVLITISLFGNCWMFSSEAWYIRTARVQSHWRAQLLQRCNEIWNCAFFSFSASFAKNWTRWSMAMLKTTKLTTTTTTTMMMMLKIRWWWWWYDDDNKLSSSESFKSFGWEMMNPDTDEWRQADGFSKSKAPVIVW